MPKTRRFSLSALSLSICCSLLVSGCRGCARQVTDRDREDWGGVAAQLDSLQAAQNALRDSLAARAAHAGSEVDDSERAATEGKR